MGAGRRIHGARPADDRGETGALSRCCRLGPPDAGRLARRDRGPAPGRRRARPPAVPRRLAGPGRAPSVPQTAALARRAAARAVAEGAVRLRRRPEPWTGEAPPALLEVWRDGAVALTGEPLPGRLHVATVVPP